MPLGMPLAPALAFGVLDVSLMPPEPSLLRCFTGRSRRQGPSTRRAAGLPDVQNYIRGQEGVEDGTAVSGIFEITVRGSASMNGER